MGKRCVLLFGMIYIYLFYRMHIHEVVLSLGSKSHRWCNGQDAPLEWDRLCVGGRVGSNQRLYDLLLLH